MGLHNAFLVSEEQLDGLQYPVTAPPMGGPEYDQWLAQLPSIGSANHFNGTCGSVLLWDFGMALKF